MANIQRMHQTLLERILRGEGQSSQAQRKAAFDKSGDTGAIATIVQKVALHAYKVTDADVAAARGEGLTEDQLFELMVCAAVGQATRQYQSGMAALDAVTREA
jgi:alkylhydroperoxidase family enzyme